MREVADRKHRANWLIELLPVKRNRGVDPRPGPRGERGYGRSATLIAKVVQVDLAGARGFGHLREIEARVCALHGKDKPMREVLHSGKVMFGVDGRDNVETLTARGLQEAFQPKLLQARTDVARSLSDRGPG